MKKILIAGLAIVLLIGGGIYLKKQSSYSEYERLQQIETVPEAIPSIPSIPSDVDYSPSGDDHPEVVEAEDERTPEDIALDRRLDEERKRNEKSKREKGIVGVSLRSTIDIPELSMDDLIRIIETVETYMREHPDRFPEPADDGTKRRTPDPRIENRLYAAEKSGIIKGFEDDNLVAWEVKKQDGEYTMILLGRDS